eukprot:1205382-Rhodomonas_salina.1
MVLYQAPNDFSKLSEYFVKKAVVEALAKARERAGEEISGEVRLAAYAPAMRCPVLTMAYPMQCHATLPTVLTNVLLRDVHWLGVFGAVRSSVTCGSDMANQVHSLLLTLLKHNDNSQNDNCRSVAAPHIAPVMRFLVFDFGVYAISGTVLA